MVIDSPSFSDQVREIGSHSAQGQSFGGYLRDRWTTACDALAVPVDQAARTARLLHTALPAWAADRIGTVPTQPSYVADDGFPAELSVNWSGTRPELRVLFDFLGDTRKLLSLVSTAATSRWERIHEIFTPRAGRPTASPLWHSVAWRPPSSVTHKTYFGLYEWPLAQRFAAVGEAMERLDMAAAWDSARTQVESVDGDREIEFFAVDLADEAHARVKVYYRNHDAGVDELNRIASVAQYHDEDSALAAYRTLAGGRTDAGTAALSCLAFRSGLDQAAECTTYLRLPSLAADDLAAVDRTAELLRRDGVDTDRFRALAAGLARGRLADSTGLLELVSYRAAGRRADVTTYFRFPVFDRSAAQALAPVDLA